MYKSKLLSLVFAITILYALPLPAMELPENKEQQTSLWVQSNWQSNPHLSKSQKIELISHSLIKTHNNITKANISTVDIASIVTVLTTYNNMAQGCLTGTTNPDEFIAIYASMETPLKAIVDLLEVEKLTGKFAATKLDNEENKLSEMDIDDLT